ncbi:hypothetical protein HELRODRAFT_177957 [Helobdella robusta]|uniref:Uncharacterized protein n=1 Tax=Helobdella robusta TaxID=6412 RepID=T1FCI6_HELRO|nr:hypothetical protein HELRODRAFT_177957 [Helobdella robusta]ESN97526.1 hypothetical protein HELRODRAFT_177957 [Helobdella robusta]
MICKCVFLVCSLFLLSGEAENKGPSLELLNNLEKQDLMKALTDSFKEIQDLLQERMAINEKILAHTEIKQEMLNDLENYMNELVESSVGDSHIEVGPAMAFIKKYVAILNKEKAKVSGDQVFDKAWYAGNKKSFAFAKDAIRMVSKEIPVIQSAETSFII